jgi:hypothetical protein
MNDWSRDQLIDSWVNDFEQGEPVGCIASLGDLLMPSMTTYSPPSVSKPKHKKPKQPKRKKPTKQQLIDQQLLDELGSIDTPEPAASIPIQATNDNWFLEWLGVEPPIDNGDEWFLEWLNIDTKDNK